MGAKINTFRVTYQIGEAENPDTICTRYMQAEDSDMAVVKVLSEKTEGDFSLSDIIMLRITDVQQVE